MQRLTLTFLIATAALAIGTISTPNGQAAAGDQATALAMACCDEPPPPCWPGFPPCDDKKDAPPGGSGQPPSEQ